MNSKILSLNPDDLSIPERHGFLLNAVAPRPIAFVSTIDLDGQVNLSPFSFFNVFSSNPPVMIFSPARRGRDNTTKHTFENVKAVPECVISIVNHPMVEQMSLASTEYPKDVCEFDKAGFTQVASEIVKPPRVGESPANFECKVQQIIELGDQGAAGNLIICRVVKMHFRSEYLTDGMLDTEKLDLVGRMGGIWYNQASGSSLFEIPKPLSTLGIGIDALSAAVRNSPILTGNDLGRLGNLDALPTEVEIRIVQASDLYQSILTSAESDPENFQKVLHIKAQEMINADKNKEALALLYCFTK